MVIVRSLRELLKGLPLSYEVVYSIIDLYRFGPSRRWIQLSALRWPGESTGKHLWTIVSVLRHSVFFVSD